MATYTAVIPESGGTDGTAIEAADSAEALLKAIEWVKVVDRATEGDWSGFGPDTIHVIVMEDGEEVGRAAVRIR